MRDFDRREQRHQHRFGDHRMAKPLLIGAALIIVLGLLAMECATARYPWGKEHRLLAGVRSSGAVADPVWRSRFSPGNVRYGTRAASNA